MADMIIDLLPPEIKTDIFSRLPLDLIIQCKLLCKTWRTLIDELLHDPSFAGKHTHQLLSSPASSSSYSTSFLGRENFYNTCSQSHITDDHNDNHRSIVGSCNGFVCLVTESKSLEDQNVYICNPVTNEYANLLPQSNQCLEKQCVVATGFGYHPCTKEYKFVRITCESTYRASGKLIYVSVYTLGSGRWSTKDVEFLHDRRTYCRSQIPTAVGLLFNGVLYWSISPMGNIVSFELDTEEFRLVPSPPKSRESTADELGVLGGCFCVIRTNTRDGSKDIWVMNKEEGEDEDEDEENYTWTEKFRIKPVGCEIERAIPPFVLYENYFSRYSYMKFDSYDPNTRSLNHLIDMYTIDFKMVDNRCDILPYMSGYEMIPYMSGYEMIPYMMSLVSLKALGESSYFVPRRESCYFVPRKERKRKRNQK